MKPHSESIVKVFQRIIDTYSFQARVVDESNVWLIGKHSILSICLWVEGVELSCIDPKTFKSYSNLGVFLLTRRGKWKPAENLTPPKSNNERIQRELESLVPLIENKGMDILTENWSWLKDYGWEPTFIRDSKEQNRITEEFSRANASRHLAKKGQQTYHPKSLERNDGFIR